ncbi:hypothetical protein FSP39_022683 [Pinctada imbricata]|uniref:VWFD domain-containing protein n=1 Tax=Pinctada imbricata TaxID=66713 RepID=A0AA88YGC4_PINIB|nr:hypothetical protein FSP39_022683 [Pinctada imbricata]
MAVLSYPPMPPIYWMTIVCILTMCPKPGISMPRPAVTYGRINKTLGEDPECIPLRTQLECIISLDVKCKRNIQYEGIKQGIKINMNRTGCHVNGVTLRPDDSRAPDPGDKIYQDLLMCSLKGKRSERKYKHCSLFGDPHLRTFDNEFQTCKVEGTWSLIYNRNLSVQVTNDPVVSDGSATATSKVTKKS